MDTIKKEINLPGNIVVCEVCRNTYYSKTKQNSYLCKCGNEANFISDISDIITCPECKQETLKLLRSHIKNFNSLILQYSEPVQFHKNEAELHFNSGIANFAKSDFDAAISDFSEAISLDPDYVQAYFKRGLANYTKENYEAAILDFNEAIRLNSEDAKAFYNRGLTNDKKRDYNSAIRDFTEAIRLDPKNFHAYRLRGFIFFLKGGPQFSNP